MRLGRRRAAYLDLDLAFLGLWSSFLSKIKILHWTLSIFNQNGSHLAGDCLRISE
jgi:hypothetical protein